MKIKNFRIKNFRTITADQTINLQDGITIVGPNNSGKSNTLLALYYFFTARTDQLGYSAEADLPFGHEGVQTSLTCFFSLDLSDPFDNDIHKALAKMKKLLDEDKQDDVATSFSLNLVFRPVPVYQIFPGVKQNLKRRLEYSDLQRHVIDRVLSYFKCYRIPSEKSVEKIYSDFVMPLVKKEIAKAISPYHEVIKNSIKSLSFSINDTLSQSGVENVNVTLDYPEDGLENLIATLDLEVDDRSKTSIYSKGMGVQSTVLFSALEWVTKQQSDNHIVWLIEEPETYMHPALANKASRVLERLGKSSTVVKTTHSLSFLPNDPLNVAGIIFSPEANSTTITTYKTIHDATSDIRGALGVKFSDYFSLSEVNIFVEGETDVEYLKSAMESYNHKHKRQLFMQGCDFRITSFGGCSNLTGFLRANYEFIRKEVVAVSLFDCDDAGIKATKELKGYLGTRGGFLPDRDYTYVPGGTIESVFPDDWIYRVKADHPSWLEIDYDAAKTIISVEVEDNHKKQFMNTMLDYMRNNPYFDSHPPKFDALLEALDERIEKAYKKLYMRATPIETPALELLA